MRLQDIASRLNVSMTGDPERVIRGVAPFNKAGPDDLTLADQPAFLNAIDTTAAAAVIVPDHFQAGHLNLLLAANPRVAFAQAIHLFWPPPEPLDDIHPLATVGANFCRGSRVQLSAGVTVGNNVTMGDQVVVYPGVYIGDNVRLGSQVAIHPHVSILAGTIIGDRVTIQAGTVIGSDGFGYAPDQDGRYLKMPHLGFVQLDDEVEIGANNCIDRATFGRTWLQRGVKTDNLVQIAHNVTIGADTVIAAGSGIAGSTTIGRQVVIAGQVGISGHITIGDKVTIGPKSGILQSVAPGQVVSGMPGLPHKLWLKAQQLVGRLPSLRKQIRDTEKRVAALEKVVQGDQS